MDEEIKFFGIVDKTTTFNVFNPIKAADIFKKFNLDSVNIRAYFKTNNEKEFFDKINEIYN